MSTSSSFHADRAEFRRRDGDVETRWAVCVAPDADCEVRAVTLVNHGNRPREVELTSFAEVCLNHRRADQAHPAFAKLFLETRIRRRTAAHSWCAADHGVRTRIRSGRFTSRHPASDERMQSSTRRIVCAFSARPYFGAAPPPWTPAHVCRRRPVRCWIRFSACDGASASSRERQRASRS